MIVVLLVISAFISNKASAETLSGTVNNYVTCSMKDYSSTGRNIYDDYMAGRISIVSYNWKSSNESHTRWGEKSKTYSFVMFDQAGNYTISFDMKYRNSGGSKTYSFSATWNITIEGGGGGGSTDKEITLESYSISVDQNSTKDINIFHFFDFPIQWTIDNSSIASGYAIKDGLTFRVTGKSPGVTWARVKDAGGGTASCKITVNKVEEPNVITLSDTKLTLKKGDTSTITANISGPNNSYCQWTNSNSSVIHITSDGKKCNIKALNTGEAILRAYAYDGTSAECMITVKAADITVKLTPSSLKLKVGETGKILATVTNGYAENCNWSISNSEVAEIRKLSNGYCEVMGLSEGTAFVEAEYEGISSQSEITVTKSLSESEDLYLVGSLTGWDFLEDFKLDKNTSTLYLDYLGGEFIIATKDFTYTYGLEDASSSSTLIVDKQYVLEEYSNPMKVMTDGLYHVKISFQRNSKTLKLESSMRPFSSSTTLYRVGIRTSENSGYICQFVPEGSRLPFFIISDDEWTPDAWLLDKETYTEILENPETHIYLTPVITHSCYIGVSFKKKSGVSSISDDRQARLQNMPNGVRLINIPIGIEVNCTDIQGIEHKISIADSPEMEIPMTSGQTYIISLSNGQQFKVLK